jgi:hypothetical protein
MTTTINASNVSGLIQTADTSGSLQLQTNTLPAVTIDSSQNTTVNNSLTVNTNLTVTGSTTFNSSVLKSGAVQTASGASVDFTVPSWVKRITVMFNNVTCSAGNPGVQLGYGTSPVTIVSSGYVGGAADIQNGNLTSVVSKPNGFPTENTNSNIVGLWTICNISGNTWTASWNWSNTSSHAGTGSGYILLSGTLTTVRAFAGTSTFSTGSVNIIYE